VISLPDAAFERIEHMGFTLAETEDVSLLFRLGARNLPSLMADITHRFEATSTLHAPQFALHKVSFRFLTAPAREVCSKFTC
jgi:hypothetical protein